MAPCGPPHAKPPHQPYGTTRQSQTCCAVSRQSPHNKHNVYSWTFLCSERSVNTVMAHVGPWAVLVWRQRWDSAVPEQWAVAIATPSLHRAHMGTARLHKGTEFIRQVLNESLKVWLAHAWACSNPTSSKLA